VAVEPDTFDGRIGTGVAADEGTGRQIGAAAPALNWMGIIPAMAVGGCDMAGGDVPNFFMFPYQIGKVGFGGRIGIFATVGGRGLDDENGFVTDNATDLIVFAVAGLDRFTFGENTPIAFARPAQVRSGIFEQGNQTRLIVGGGFGQGKEAGRLRARQGTDHHPVSFAEALDTGGSEGDGFDLGVQTDVESVGEDVGEVVVSLQHVKARTEAVGDDFIVLIDNRQDNGAKLTQADEKLLFEIIRLHGEVLDAEVHEMSLPELGRTPSSDDGRTLEDAHTDTCGLQGLGAAEAGKAGSDNRDGSRFVHKNNVDISTPGAIILTRP